MLQITLDPTSSTTENLEAIAPLIKSIQDSDSEQIYLRSLDKFVEEKEKEIQKICEDNYEVSPLGLYDKIEEAKPDSETGLYVFRVDIAVDQTRDGESQATDRGARWADGRCREVLGREGLCQLSH